MKSNHTKYKIQDRRYRPRGIAALVTVLSLGTLIFTVSFATAILTFWSIKGIDSNRKSLKAYYTGSSGVQDALIKLQRNKDFSSEFNLSVNSTDDVSVTVVNNDNSATITSTALSGGVNKKIQTIIDIDTTTGLITPTSTIELTL